MALLRRICETTASLSALPAADSYTVLRPNMYAKRTTTRLGDRAFAAARQSLWNSLL